VVGNWGGRTRFAPAKKVLDRQAEKAERWTGFLAKVEAAPFLPICRSQIDVRFDCSDDVLARHMPGFHWMTAYGDYLREIGYAAYKIGLKWDNISALDV
jgi:hypothetical protein